MIARVSGTGAHIAEYEISDREMAAGSTLGAPKATIVVKATGALEKVFSCEAGLEVLGTLVLHHWDARTGIPLIAEPGEFLIHPDRQEHFFELVNGAAIREQIVVLNGAPEGPRLHDVDPPAAYYAIELSNEGPLPLEIETYASVRLGGAFSQATRTAYDRKLRAFLVENDDAPGVVRAVSCSVRPQSYEVSIDKGKPVAQRFPGRLSNSTIASCHDPIGIFHLRFALDPGKRTGCYFTLTFSLEGEEAARRVCAALPKAEPAIERTRTHFEGVLDRAILMTPETEVNRGVLWAKANMLRCQQLTGQGWCFVNDPTRSNNSVARDTCWYSLAADYVSPHFARESLLWYAEHLTRDGMAVEYFDIRNGESETYGLDVNDNTPLLLIALWHHYCVTGDRDFLERVFPNAVRAAGLLIHRRGDDGLVWCRANGTGSRGIVGWRNVIQGYRLDGATTELNSECYAALRAAASMAGELNERAPFDRFEAEARSLKAAINDKLFDPTRNLYYLAIDWDGARRTDVTCDLVFPVMFGVAESDVANHIVSTLSRPEFWTDAGLHTVPRSAIDYGPAHASGLLGGVWAGPTFWFAAAAAGFNPEFMAFALAASFRHYAKDPRRYNTVPGQFSEWLHGETLTNQGMMLSPWFAPKYVWAAIEHAAGLEVTKRRPRLRPNLPSAWPWIGARNATVRGHSLSWFAVRTGEIVTYASSNGTPIECDHAYDEDVSADVIVTGDHAMSIALRGPHGMAILVGNTLDRTITTSLTVPREHLPERFQLRSYSNLFGAWRGGEPVDEEELRRGFPVQVARHGFCVLEFSEEA